MLVDDRLRKLETTARKKLTEKKWRQATKKRKTSPFERWCQQLRESYRAWARTPSGNLVKTIALYKDQTGKYIND